MALPLILLFLACRPSTSPPAGPTFPDHFLWGTAIAGFQADPGCPSSDCTDTHSDWYQWVTSPEIIGDSSLFVTGEPLSDGPGMWETMESDADLMKADGFSGLRLSIEWSRLFPDASAEQATTVDELAAHADPAAVARYHAIFQALRARGLQPLVTLNHYTLPLWVHDGVACHDDLAHCPANGWVDGARIEPLIALYAGYCGREFGGDVDLWATLNEPLAVPLSGYLVPGSDRSNPPGVSQEGAAAAAVIQHEIEGSAAMYDAVHAEDTVDADGDGVAATVGIVLNMAQVLPRDPTRGLDVQAAKDFDHLYNRLFLDGLVSGAWDDDLNGTFDRNRDDLAGRLDWVGVNYYTVVTVGGTGFPLIPEIPALDFVPIIDWHPEPSGFGPVLDEAASYGLPVYVTENGDADPSDDVRVQSLQGDLHALQASIAAGDDVRGYFYWTFVDNYEWNHGMSLKFGLYALDTQTKARTGRPTLDAYEAIVKRNGF